MNAFIMLLRREIWEHRGLLFAPFIIVGVCWLFYIATLLLGMRSTGLDGLIEIAGEYAGLTGVDGLTVRVAGFPMAVCFLVFVFMAFYYALDCLLSERRDRSILFWRSLPVSDLTTIASKLFTILVVTPIIIFIAGVVGHLGGLVLTSLITGIGDSDVWRESSLLSTWGTWAYTLFTMVIWMAPVVAWFMFVSSWVTKVAFLMAVVPILVLGALEAILLNSSVFRDAVWGRVWFRHYPQAAFPEGQFNFINFLTTPETWIGLVVAVLFVAAAVYVRRYREDA